jgi:hypothetical protein
MGVRPSRRATAGYVGEADPARVRLVHTGLDQPQREAISPSISQRVRLVFTD